MKTLFALIISAVLVAGCGNAPTKKIDQMLSEQTEAVMQESIAQTGMPAIKNFQERKLMKTILELRDQSNLICYAYLFVEMTGELRYFGKCIGFGLPYSTQYTAPTKVWTGYEGRSEMVPQVDPNGLYMPESAEATWIMLINPKTGEPAPVYVESRVIISPFPLQ